MFKTTEEAEAYGEKYKQHRLIRSKLAQMRGSYLYFARRAQSDKDFDLAMRMATNAQLIRECLEKMEPR